MSKYLLTWKAKGGKSESKKFNSRKQVKLCVARIMLSVKEYGMMLEKPPTVYTREYKWRLDGKEDRSFRSNRRAPQKGRQRGKNRVQTLQP